MNLQVFPSYTPSDRQDGLAEVMSLSGGRSSAYALMSLINGGFGKSNNHFILFQNMGKEDETCYRFLKDIQDETGLRIDWLEYTLTDKFYSELIRPDFSYDKFNNCEYENINQILDVEKLRSFEFKKSKNNFWYTELFSDRLNNVRKVDFDSASRNGKPFCDLFLYRCAIRIMKGEGLIMPSVGNRWCTGDGKEKVGDRYLSNMGIKEFISYKGMRFDEPDRIQKVKNKNNSQDSIWYDCPLEHTKTTKIDVMLAWANQVFDLGSNKDGSNSFMDVIGNCDVCILKKKIKKLWLIQQGKGYLFFKQIESLCNNYNGDTDAMCRQHGTYKMLEQEALSMDEITIDKVLSDEEVEVSCFGCGD